MFPTLEEFTYIVGILIRYKIPFIGGEEVPKSHIIEESLHVPKVKVENGLITKGGIFRFPHQVFGGKRFTLLLLSSEKVRRM